MAIVKNQDLPLDYIEDKVDPPIPFIDSYRRVVGEGIDHPELPAGEEIVTGRKTESRPGTRSDSEFSKPSDREAWRDEFKNCLACWGNQVDTEGEVDPCHSAGSRHYVTPWEYVSGAQNTYFNQFMKECLDWAVAHPGEIFPKCEDLQIGQSDDDFCPNGQISFSVSNGVNPAITGMTCGELYAPMIWQAPAIWGDCPEEVIIYFTDDDGRKGCGYLHRMTEIECCCEINPELEISYTALTMGCGAEQELGINPDAHGCAPYSWELDGDGSISETEGETTIYTSPESNPQCVSRPTITLRDGCGNSAAIQLAINCYSGAAMALQLADFTSFICPGNNDIDCDGNCFPDQVCIVRTLQNTKYKCDSSILDFCDTTTPTYDCWPDCFNGAEGLGCWSNQCGGHIPGPTICGNVYDERSEAMKAGGCCPMNPLTGLPY